jgi:hypothetical protein
MNIQLDWSEVLAAGNIGLMRRVASLKNGIKDQTHDQRPEFWRQDIEGACAEMACCKALGIYWTAGINTFKAPDAANNVQIRYTPSSRNSLIIRPHDPDEDVYFLISGAVPNYTVHGWIKGSEGKQEQFLKDANNIGKTAFFVPQQALNTVESYIS